MTFRDLLNYPLKKNSSISGISWVFYSVALWANPAFNGKRLNSFWRDSNCYRKSFCPISCKPLLQHFSLGKNVTKAIYQANCAVRRQLEDSSSLSNWQRISAKNNTKPSAITMDVFSFYLCFELIFQCHGYVWVKLQFLGRYPVFHSRYMQLFLANMQFSCCVSAIDLESVYYVTRSK